MTLAQETRYYSPQEYLELEVNSEIRHEYINGLIIPMTGGTPNHNQLAGNFYAMLNFALKRQPYQVFVTDQRLWIPSRKIHTYPDIMVVKTPLEYQEGRTDTLVNPVMIAEVLSKSTKGYDRDEKFAAYRTIPTLQEYILIDQYTIHIEQYFKTDNNQWIFSEFTDGNINLNLASISCQMTLSDIYDKVDFNIQE
ncbi:MULTISPECIES: Uma2 family endonuclease [Dolichospermum]|uniref:Uma2 family endonuclease n=1 Tax=Dolichospermum TaxID=748770 RepID=UPI0004852AB7|nr:MULTISPECIES: Uma2 family endonuclease [Dolichospermum]MBD2442823.1 Uma2 family endonuclease [Dolichospermum sp. FACHB-1091]MDB9455851.1 Uma2 family endonuclease [Dolichospermum circinale CS-541/06]MDB9462510.1 Uma2 family endonuclease [Dolichospermum circinale CS-541/04]MDB9475339.1 Uma2 family endonuclease [Dolichospermum circinale CS-537/11]MDB9478234.1 Uma2 family endonuclease [Dolichospermum circinale CS-537/03]